MLGVGFFRNLLSGAQPSRSSRTSSRSAGTASAHSTQLADANSGSLHIGHVVLQGHPDMLLASLLVAPPAFFAHALRHKVPKLEAAASGVA